MPTYAYRTQHINICMIFEDMLSNSSYNDIIKVLIKHYTQSKKSRILHRFSHLNLCCEWKNFIEN